MLQRPYQVLCVLNDRLVDDERLSVELVVQFLQLTLGASNPVQVLFDLKQVVRRLERVLQ